MILPQYGFQWFRGSKWFELFNVKLIFIRMPDWTNKKQLSFLNWKLLYLEKWCFFHLHFFLLRLVGVVCFWGEKGLEFFYGITLWNLILIQASYLSLSHTHSHTRTHTPTPTHMHAHLTLNRKKTISDVNSSRVNILSLNLRKHFCHDGLKNGPRQIEAGWKCWPPTKRSYTRFVQSRWNRTKCTRRVGN